MATALPAAFNPSILVPAPNDLAQQYSRVRVSESTAQQTLSAASSAAAKKRADVDLIALRVLGQIMIQTSSQEGLLHLGRAIQSCVSDEQLIKLGKFYRRYFVQLFYKAKGPTPHPSQHPSRPSFEEERVPLEMREANLAHATTKEKALRRDGRRCLLTGAYDKSDPSQESELHTDLTGQKGVELECAHIIPEGLNNLTQASIDHAEDLEILKLFGFEADEEPERKVMPLQECGCVPGAQTQVQINQSSTMWTMISTFGSPALVDELRGMDIHRLENVLTINHDDHDSIDKLLLWFEATGSLNEYKVCVRKQKQRPLRPVDPPTLYYIRPVDKVTFFGTAELPAPSPRYLALHAACCRIAHLSGAADHWDSVERDLEHFRGAPAFVVSTQALDAISEALDFGEFKHRAVLAN
ncbi:hypothetical protein C8R47DRAFT_1007238 [Mycena vitilis]|nr:hypothetical protein C8R47DRAFT_1007238 [Mycena vitilis]